MAEFQIGDLVMTLGPAGMRDCTGMVTGFCSKSPSGVRVAIRGKRNPKTNDGAYIFHNTMLRKICLDEFLRKYETTNHHYAIPTPERIIMSKDSKVMVVLWEDGTKTIVRCAENIIPDPYAAYCAAFAKKCYGSNSKLKKTIEKLMVLQNTKVKKEKKNGN